MPRIALESLMLLGVPLLILGGPSPGHADCPAPQEEFTPIELKFDAAHQYGDGPPIDPLLGAEAGGLWVDKVTTDDLSMSPERWNYLGVVPKPNIINFFWGGPRLLSQPPDDWGRATFSDPDEPLMGFLDPWSPLLGLHGANMLGVPAQGDPFGSPNMLSTGYFGPISSREVQGDPTGISCDETTFEMKAPGDNPAVHYNWSTRGARVIKDDWDLTWHWFPASVYFLTCGATQFGYATGTYKGKPVELVGAFDRYYLAADSVFYLLDKRLLNVFAARGVDGKFEYGLVFIFKNAVWNGNSKFIAGGFYCRDGEGCVATNELKLRNMTWKADPKFPHSIIPVEGTYIVGDKELYMKATDGFQLKQVQLADNKVDTLADAIVKVTEVVTVPLQWTDAMGIWREKNSPKQNLGFIGIETTEFNWQDIAEIEGAIGLPDVPGGGGIDIPGGTGGGMEAGDGGAGGASVTGDAGATGPSNGPGSSNGDAIGPDGGTGGDPVAAPPKGTVGGCGGCAVTPGAQFADSGILLVALASLLRRRRSSRP